MRAVIVDDNQVFGVHFKNVLSTAAKSKNMVMEVDVFSDIQEFMRVQAVYDIYFLDIVMPGQNGFELIRFLKEHYVDAEFVFVSAFDFYMQEAFYVQPSAFVRKNMLEKDLSKYLDHLMKRIELRRETVLLRNNKAVTPVRPAEVEYCQSVEHYVCLVLADGKGREMVRAKLDAVETVLRSYDFVRIHQRYLINLRYVYRFRNKKVVMMNGNELPLSRGKKGNAESILMNWLSRQKE